MHPLECYCIILKRNKTEKWHHSFTSGVGLVVGEDVGDFVGASVSAGKEQGPQSSEQLSHFSPFSQVPSPHTAAPSMRLAARRLLCLFPPCPLMSSLRRLQPHWTAHSDESPLILQRPDPLEQKPE